MQQPGCRWRTCLAADARRSAGATATCRGALAGADPCEFEHLVQEPFEVFGLVARDLEELAAVGVAERRVRHEECSGRALDRGERGAQIVRDRGEEAGARPCQIRVQLDLVRGRFQPDAVERDRERRTERIERGPFLVRQGAAGLDRHREIAEPALDRRGDARVSVRRHLVRAYDELPE